MEKKAVTKKKSGKRAAKKVAKRTRSTENNKKPLNPRNPNIAKPVVAVTPEPVVLSKKETELKIEEATFNSENLPWFTNQPDRSHIVANEE